MLTLAILFAAAFLAMVFFVWRPQQLLRLYDSLMGGDAAGELGDAQDGFLKLTRRLCAAPMVICFVAMLYFAKGAIDDARQQPLREQRAQERKERLQKYSAGSVYAKALEQERSKKKP